MIVDIKISNNHCLALNNYGQVFSWGMALDGALGYEVANLEACQIAPSIVSVNSKIEKIFVGP